MGINYEYLEYTQPLKYPYVVGEYSEIRYWFEANATAAELILTCFTRGAMVTLIQLTNRLKRHFRDYRAVLPNGTAHIAYDRAITIRTGEEDLRRMELYFDILFTEGC